MKMAAHSLLSPGTKVTMGASAGTVICFSPSLYLTRRGGDGLSDAAIGHHAGGLEVPAVVPLGNATHRLGEDEELEGFLPAVGLWQTGDTHVRTRLHIGEGGPHHRRDRRI